MNEVLIRAKREGVICLIVFITDLLIILMFFYANFMPISLVYAKETGERKRTKGVPLDPLRRSRFQTRSEINAIINLTLACQKSDKRAVGWFSTVSVA